MDRIGFGGWDVLKLLCWVNHQVFIKYNISFSINYDIIGAICLNYISNFHIYQNTKIN